MYHSTNGVGTLPSSRPPGSSCRGGPSPASRRRRPSPCWKRSTSCASDGTARPTGFLRPNSRWSRLLRTQFVQPPLGDGGVVPPSGRVPPRRRSGWRGRAATATSERRCCRLPPSLMPTAACRSRPVRATGSPSARFALDEGPAPAGRGSAGRCGRRRQHRRQRAPRREDGNRRVPDGAADLVADLYRRMPEARIRPAVLRSPSGGVLLA